MALPKNPLRELDQAGLDYIEGRISRREYIGMIEQTYPTGLYIFRAPSLILQAIGYRIRNFFG